MTRKWRRASVRRVPTVTEVKLQSSAKARNELTRDGGEPIELDLVVPSPASQIEVLDPVELAEEGSKGVDPFILLAVVAVEDCSGHDGRAAHIPRRPREVCEAVDRVDEGLLEEEALGIVPPRSADEGASVEVLHSRLLGLRGGVSLVNDGRGSGRTSSRGSPIRMSAP